MTSLAPNALIDSYPRGLFFDMNSIFHITTRRAWQAALAAGRYEAESLKSEGFIHLSSARQVVRVANRFFKGQSGLVLLHVNQDLVSSPVKYECVDGDTFPHVYGLLNLDAVVGVYDFREEAGGGFSLPMELRQS